YLNDYRLLASYCVIQLIFALPISAVVFAMSMVVSNLLGTGIELANFGALIPKALILVLLANLVGLMPCVGAMMAVGIWFIGAMVFFGLEAWETRFLVVFNWALGCVMWLWLIRALAALVAKQ